MDFGDRQTVKQRRLLWAMMFQSSNSRRKHGRRRRIARCCACPRTISFNDHSDDLEAASFDLDSAAPLLIEGDPSARKASLIRELMAKKKKKTTTSSDWGNNPIIIIHKTPNNAMIPPKPAKKPTQESSNNKQLSRAISTPQQLKDCLDVLDLFMVNKNNFLDILNDEDIYNHHQSVSSSLLSRQNSTRNLGLRKSGSYPAVNSKSPRFLRPSVLEDKHMEVWSSPAKRSAAITSLVVTKKNKSEDIDRVRAGSISQKVRCFLGRFIRRRILNKGRNKKKNIKSSRRRVSNEETAKRTNSVRDEMVRARRSISLSESLSRYAPLIDQSSSFVAWRYKNSKSLRLTTENKSDETNENRLKYNSYRRRLSMTDLDSIYPAKEPISRLTWLESDVTKKSDSVEEIEEPSGINPNAGNEEETDFEIENRVSEEEQDVENVPIEELNSLQKETMKLDSFRFEFDRIEDADFNYVKDILDLSGFIDQDCAANIWHSLDQPLSPLVYKEMESLLKYEEGENDENRSTHRQLLFDMMNEELLGIFESSLTYFPKPLLQSSQCRPMPKGERVLEQVWKRISKHRVPDTEEVSLYDIFCGEMNRGDGWMNIQFDCEDVALELEDMIMDQLLEEILC